MSTPNTTQETNNTGRKGFLDKYQGGQYSKRGNIFDNYEVINSFDVDLPNTSKKLIISLCQSKIDPESYLLKWQIGKSSLFIDAKIAFVVSEAMRYITEDIVPDNLKPTSDSKPGDEK